MTVREAASSPLERAEVWAASAGAMADALARTERTRRVEGRDVPQHDCERIALLLRRAGAPGASPHDCAARAVVRKTLTRVFARSLTDDDVVHYAQALACTLDILRYADRTGASETPDGVRNHSLTDVECADIRALHRFLEQLARDGTSIASAPRYPTSYGRAAGTARSGYRGAD